MPNMDMTHNAARNVTVNKLLDRTVPRSIRGAMLSGYQILGRRGMLWNRVREVDGLLRGDRASIEEMVTAKLAALLRHAATTVPFYRELLGRNEIAQENARELLQSLPVMTKPKIRELGEALLSDQVGRKTYWNTSGGSTGEPIRIRQDRRYSDENRTSELLFMHWAGYQPGEKHVLLWSVPKETFGAATSFHERAFRLAHNQHYFNCYSLNDEILDRWMNELLELKPAVVEAYVESVFELSRRANGLGKNLGGPKAVITSAGVLSPEKREEIEKAFSCPVLNRYGSREVGDIACSCRENPALHVNECRAVMEILDEANRDCSSDSEGEIMVTDLSNYSMPLLRYQIQDRGVWAHGSCSCGLQTKRLARVSGRSTDCLIGSGGSRLSGVALTTWLYAVPGIRRYQFHQRPGEKVTFLVQPNEGVEQGSLARDLSNRVEKLSTQLGVAVDLKFVDEITPGRSGKYRYVISEAEESTSRAHD